MSKRKSNLTDKVMLGPIYNFTFYLVNHSKKLPRPLRLIAWLGTFCQFLVMVPVLGVVFLVCAATDFYKNI